MAEQSSRRGEAVVEADLNQPVSTPIYPFGAGGLDLNSAIDKVKVGDFTRLSNVTSNVGETRELTGRPGQTTLATAGTTHHSIVRVDDPATNDFTRMWGVDTSVYLGKSGALTSVDSGYSGNPLTLLTHRPPLSGEPWVFVGDSARNRKIRSDGLVTEIGLPAPSVAAVAALGAASTTSIATFTASDGTGGAVWTPNAGVDFSKPPIPTSVPPTPSIAFTGGTRFQAHDNSLVIYAAAQGFYQFFGLAVTRNLSVVGARPATDDDLIHLSIQFDKPANIAEVRIYFVVSTPFTPSVLPGVPGTIINPPNTDYYVKSFRPGDFSQFIQGTQPEVTAAETSRINYIRDSTLRQSDPVDPRERPEPITTTPSRPKPTQPPARSALTAVQVSTSAEQETELGIIGAPLRRGDFERYGNTAGRDWSTVTGIVIYVQQTPQAPIGNLPISVVLKQLYLTGGYDLDSSEATSQPYDWRYTHYDPRTGAEGNPSPIMAPTAFLEAARQQAVVTPTAFGDAAIRQRFYRRGGTLTADWYFEGVNTADGGAFTDTEGDLELAAADPLSIDNYQPVPTVDEAGNTVLAQPVPVYFGPGNGQLFALGDPYRPGFVYACTPGEPDHWPPSLAHEVCSPSEALQNGVVYGGQPFVFSRDKGYTLYPNISGDAGMTSAPSGCTRGLAGRWALCTGAGAIWFVANDGIFRTTGGEEQIVSIPLTPLFQGQTKNGYAPIDFTIEQALRLAVYRNELYFQYQDTSGSRQTMVLQIIGGDWRHYRFGQQNATIYSEDVGATARLLIGGVSSGASYTHDGYSDDGGAINALVRTAAWDFGQARAEKLLTDQILDCDPAGEVIYLTNLLNNWTISNPTQSLVSVGTGRVRAIFDGFGLQPQHARNISTEITWVAPTGTPPPTLYFMGVSHALQPDLTINRVTQWDDLGHPDEKYITGITLDCDTGSTTRTLHIERDFGNATSDITVIQVTTTGRHKVAFSWPALPANQVRIRPDDECKAWLLYRADWLFVPEPPRIAGWDIHFENAWDQYYTGLDLYCDTFGLDKTIEVYVDEALIGTYTINTTGRRVVHITLPWGRGHVFHFVATDANLGLLYQHRWHLQEEPSEQTNWNEPFTILGTQSDKWMKAIIFECDTFGLDKLIDVEADGVVVATLVVNADGRKVVQRAIPQALGRVWRFFPVDSNPGRLYSKRPVFDEEPFQLDRWETQETDHDLGAFQSIIEAQVTLKSADVVTLEVTTWINQDGTTVSDIYQIPPTGAVKQMKFVPFVARNGIMFKYVFTCPLPFWLYQEESHVTVQPFNGGDPMIRHPWGNSDNDRTRNMVNTSIAAATSGGGT